MDEGILAACAGEPFRCDAILMLDGVYPRVCGGAQWCYVWDLCRQGLSPRVRGSRLNRLGDRGACGSIPACAGEPSTLYP